MGSMGKKKPIKLKRIKIDPFKQGRHVDYSGFGPHITKNKDRKKRRQQDRLDERNIEDT